MASVYSDYHRDKIGWFFGLRGWQLGLLAAAALPVFWALSRGAWPSAAVLGGGWVLILGFTIVPVRGRSAAGWLAASALFTIGGQTGWSRWRARASRGSPAGWGRWICPAACRGSRSTTGRRTGQR